MADKLNFSLVSPERELYAGEVDQVDLPGTEGDMGILPNHSPLMAAIRTGAITVYTDNSQIQFLVQGGFADVTPDGLTVLAEKAMPITEVTADFIAASIEAAQANLEGQTGEAALAIQQDIAGLQAITVSA